MKRDTKSHPGRNACGTFLLLAAVLSGQGLVGTVVNSVTKDVVPGARIIIYPAGLVSGALFLPASIRAYNPTADEHGKFSLASIPEGDYICIPSQQGFSSPSSQRERVVTIAAGGQTSHLQLELIPDAKISGRVLDGKGRPVPGVIVEVKPSPNPPSTPQRATIFPKPAPPAGTFVACDAQGRFSAQVAGEGSYTIEATPPREAKRPEPVDGREMGWARTFYPGLIARESAARIPVYPGAELAGLEIKLQAVPLHHVRGVLLDPKGKAVPEVTVRLGEDPILTDRDGAFDLLAMDGKGALWAEQYHSEGYRRAVEPIVVAGHDVEGIKLHFVLCFSIEGILTYDPPLPSGATATPVPLSLTLAGTSATPQFASTRSDTHGQFRIDKIFPGTYTIGVFGGSLSKPTGPEYYLAAIRLGGRDVMTSDGELLSGPTKLEVQYRQDGGTVAGTVEACGEGVVILLPKEPILRPTGIQGIPCDATGHYRFTGLRPGEYYVWAADKAHRTDLDMTILEQADKVTVRAAETTALDLKVMKL